MGLMSYTRMLYGIASAPSIFQRTMEQVLQGIDGVLCYLDDILITSFKFQVCFIVRKNLQKGTCTNHNIHL